MRTLFDAVAQELRLTRQAEQIDALTREVEKLRAENERLKAAARRCVTCEYRIEVRSKRTEHKLLRRAGEPTRHTESDGEDESTAGDDD